MEPKISSTRLFVGLDYRQFEIGDDTFMGAAAGVSVGRTRAPIEGGLSFDAGASLLVGSVNDRSRFGGEARAGLTFASRLENSVVGLGVDTGARVMQGAGVTPFARPKLVYWPDDRAAIGVELGLDISSTGMGPALGIKIGL